MAETGAEVLFSLPYNRMKALIDESSVPVFFMMTSDFCPLCSEVEPYFLRRARGEKGRAVFILTDILKYGDIQSIAQDKDFKGAKVPSLFIYRDGALVEGIKVATKQRVDNAFGKYLPPS